MSKKYQIKTAVFASGSGSNFEAIVKAVQSGKLEAEVSILVCDNPDAYVLKRAEQLGITSVAFQPKSFADKADYEKEVLNHLRAEAVDLIILAGYMRIIGPTLLEAYPQRILNIHPSLLPLYPGRQGIIDAFYAGATETGVTVHIVDEGIDTGEILAQRKTAILPDDTMDSLEVKIHTIEHELFPKVIQTYINKLQKEHT